MAGLDETKLAAPCPRAGKQRLLARALFLLSQSEVEKPETARRLCDEADQLIWLAAHWPAARGAVVG